MAILAADVGYSRLMRGDEEATMTTLSARRAASKLHQTRVCKPVGESPVLWSPVFLAGLGARMRVSQSGSRARFAAIGPAPFKGSRSISR